MREEIASRLRDLSRRAGLGGVAPQLVVALAVVVGAAVLLGVWRWWPRSVAGDDEVLRSASAGAPRAQVATGSAGGARASTGAAGGAESAAARSAEATGEVFVHVVGAVRHPGVYELAGGSRVADAIRDAGGLARDAAQEAVNLARTIKDGEQILVPTHKDLARTGSAPGVAVGGGRGAGGGSAGSGVGGAGTSAAGAGSRGPVNINTADAALLDTLPGVGPSTAAKIVAEREANGPYRSVDDLGRVPGIGPKKLAQLKAAICVE